MSRVALGFTRRYGGTGLGLSGAALLGGSGGQTGAQVLDGFVHLREAVYFGADPLVRLPALSGRGRNLKVHSEMKRHSGQGIDGGIAFILALFVGIVMPYLTASEVVGLYERRGQAKPVSGANGQWYILAAIILLAPLVWFIKTKRGAQLLLLTDVGDQ